MADSAASSGLGMLLAPAQAAASGAAKAATGTSSTDVTDGNNSNFSTVLAEQGEPSSELASTQVVQQASQVAVVQQQVDEQAVDLQQVLTEGLDGGQALPLTGNPLPAVTAPVQTSATETALFAAANQASVDSLNSTGAVATVNTASAAFDSESIVGQIVDGQLASAAASAEQQANAKAALAAAQAAASDSGFVDDGSSMSGGLSSGLATVVSAAQTAETAELQVAQSTTDKTDDDGAASLTLISLLDRKSRLGEAAAQPVDTISLDLDADTFSDQQFSDSLLMKNLQADGALNLGDDLASLQQKLADLTSVLAPKSQNSIDINSLPAWRQQGVNSYGVSQPLTASMGIDVPVAKPGWGDAVLDKVMWMSSQKLETAEIALDPVDLGPMHVRISTQNDQTTVVFSSPHVQVREALDQASAQLRQNLENQGFGQVNVDVSGRNGEQQMSQQQADGFGGSAGNGGADEGAIIAERAAVPAQPVRVGLVDTFV